MAAKYLLTTLGCKVNQYESQRIRELLEALGMRAAQPGEVPDIAVVNTCAVTTEASRKTRQALRRSVRSGCPAVVAVGCAVSEDTERLRELQGVAAVIGHDADIPAELRRFALRILAPHFTAQGPSEPLELTSGRPDANRDDVWMKPIVSNGNSRASAPRTASCHANILPPAPVTVKTGEILDERIERFAGHQRAFLKVQDGCDAHCTYCIIPRLRPLLRWKPVETAVHEARGLVRAGYREIIITGIFLGAYGRPTAVRRRFASDESPLARLVEALAKVEGLKRLRLSSLEPGDVDEALLEVLVRNSACVPHLHLPLQSGSGRILRRMNRQYTADAFVAMVDRVKAALDRPAITTDVIVGFPGEAEEDFDATLEIARYAGFAKIHAFPFSPRRRTLAARWTQEFVAPDVIRPRLGRLAEVEREGSMAFRRQFIGCRERVIVEREKERTGAARTSPPIRHGRSDRYFEVFFESAEVRTGDLVPVKIVHVTPTHTMGTFTRPGAEHRPLPVFSGASL
jgi:threonylcarbamoyladenosine tRNA methylthiotransferase MtaB